MDSLTIFDFQNLIAVEKAEEEVRLCNDICGKQGLVLTEQDVKDLVKSRMDSLKNSGRIEFEGGILPKLVYAFCDSPYILQDNFTTVLAELQKAFYYFKTESRDAYSDDELIELMVKAFNGIAQGSTEYLVGSYLPQMIRYGRVLYNPSVIEILDEDGEPIDD